MSIAQKIMFGVPSGPEGAWDLSYAYYDDPFAWDISTARYSQNFSVSAQETSPQGLFFKPDGLKMYVIGASGDDVNEYDLSTAWDVSSASYSQNFSVAAQETSPSGLFFKPDGLKMYVIGASGDDVNEYDLSTAWDVSTASYSQNFSVSAQETLPLGIFFKPDGLKMYVIGTTGDDVNEYDLSTAWDISSASYSQNFSVAAQETSPSGLFFKPDGLKMYVIGTSGEDVNEYDLSTAWDISTASYSQNFSVSAQETRPQGLFFKPDGLKMYVLGSSGDDVNEYDLGGFDVSGQVDTAWSITFKPDGLEMYVVDNGASAQFIDQYTLSTAYDLSSATHAGSRSIGAQGRPRGVFFKPDGTKMFVCETTGDSVDQYSLSSAWDISSATYDSVTFSVSTQDAAQNSLFFKSDGTKMYVLGVASDAIYQYTLSTAWDISSATYDSVSFDPTAQASGPISFYIGDSGKKLYVANVSDALVYQYTLSTAWDISSATYDSVSFDAGSYTLYSIAFSEDGTKMLSLDYNSTDGIVKTYTLGPQD